MNLRRLNNNFYKESLENFNEVLSYLYKNSKDYCFIRVLSKKTNKHKAYLLKEINKSFNIKIIEKDFGKEDLMFSLNTFRTIKNGRRSNLFTVNNLAIDVDYKKIEEFKNLTPNQVLHLLEFDFFNQTIPTPNLVEYGNQIRLIYNLKETVYIPKNRNNVLILCYRILKIFSNRLKDCGGEEQNLESYFRVLNSTNTKNNSKIKMLYYVNSISYTLKELQCIWLDDVPKWYKKRKSKAKSKVVKLHNIFTLNSNRLLDFEKIQAYLNLNDINDLRARLCFLYRDYVLIKIKAQNGCLLKKDLLFAKEEMLRFNRNFNHPLRDNLIESATKVVNSNQYIYKNKTLASFLELDFSLCKELDLQSIFNVKSKKEIERDYYKRVKTKKHKNYLKALKRENKLTRKEKISKRREKIRTLLKKGIKQRDIINILSISKGTCISDIKKIKEQDFL